MAKKVFEQPNQHQSFPKMEEEILKYWEKEKVFQKSIDQRPQNKHYTFYDGPPYATGTPHYGHLLAGIIKDVIPRYWTMRGFRVERRFGWDCHGLPVENLVEKELGLKNKKDIEKIGVEKFSEECRSSVLKYVSEWRKTVRRMGRFVDMDNDYKTMEPWYMESVWWVFKSLWDKGLVYEGYKVLAYCPRCGTVLSNNEVNQPGSYQNVDDPSVFVKFRIHENRAESKEQSAGENSKFSTLNSQLLVWTTTPWTLPANTALAINSKIKYEKIELKESGEVLILAKKRIKEVIKEEYKNLGEVKAKDLIGLKYEPAFNIKAKHQGNENDYTIVDAEFVGEEEGTGVVHIAPAYGEDDSSVGAKYKLSVPQHVNDEGKIEKGWGLPGEGLGVKEADNEIKKYLKEKNLVYKIEQINHSYPHCWRCDTALIYRATTTWFVNVQKIKKDLIKNNKNIYWVPGHIKEGRFGKMIENAPDWAISRNRYWGVPLPIWRCSSCGEFKIMGSIVDLEKQSGKKIHDIHKHVIDKLILKCKCGGESKRVPEVLDVWFDSGSMPYASQHYPFENKQSLSSRHGISDKEKFEANFPADFIAEGIDQTRGWFNSLHVLSTAIFGSNAFKNVVVNGTILAEDGKKMSKRLKNYPEPDLVMEKYGADAMRFYLMTSAAVRAEDLRFSEKGVDDILKKFVLTLWNSYSFFTLSANGSNFDPDNLTESTNLLDKWILSRLNHTISLYEKNMDSYHLAKAGEELAAFLEELSNWYIRRSRSRFKDLSQNVEALSTLYTVLVEFCKILAPFMPFVTEKIYLGLAGRSVHLEDMPVSHAKLIDRDLEKKMELTREIVSKGLAERARNGIKVRQPLQELRAVSGELRDLGNEFIEIIKDEVNVKSVKISKGKELKVELDLIITKELAEEGIKRELIRHIQDLRKKAGLKVEDKVNVFVEGESEIKNLINKFKNDLQKETNVNKILEKETKNLLAEKEIKHENKQALIKLIGE